jgi:hypothetical protein
VGRRTKVVWNRDRRRGIVSVKFLSCAGAWIRPFFSVKGT